MNLIKFVVIVLIVVGVFGFVYGGFSYMKDIMVVKFGLIEVFVKEK